MPGTSNNRRAPWKAARQKVSLVANGPRNSLTPKDCCGFATKGELVDVKGMLESLGICSTRMVDVSYAEYARLFGVLAQNQSNAQMLGLAIILRAARLRSVLIPGTRIRSIILENHCEVVDLRRVLRVFEENCPLPSWRQVLLSKVKNVVFALHLSHKLKEAVIKLVRSGSYPKGIRAKLGVAAAVIVMAALASQKQEIPRERIASAANVSPAAISWTYHVIKEE